jgi:hypothetical protein
MRRADMRVFSTMKPPDAVTVAGGEGVSACEDGAEVTRARFPRSRFDRVAGGLQCVGTALSLVRV